MTRHPPHYVSTSGLPMPSAFIPFCSVGQTYLGQQLDNLSVLACDLFLPTVLQGQLCYQLDLNMTMQQGKDRGLFFVVDTNVERSIRETEGRPYIQSYDKSARLPRCISTPYPGTQTTVPPATSSPQSRRLPAQTDSLPYLTRRNSVRFRRLKNATTSSLSDRLVTDVSVLPLDGRLLLPTRSVNFVFLSHDISSWSSSATPSDPTATKTS